LKVNVCPQKFKLSHTYGQCLKKTHLWHEND
jgi:hypothetical protein